MSRARSKKLVHTHCMLLGDSRHAINTSIALSADNIKMDSLSLNQRFMRQVSNFEANCVDYDCSSNLDKNSDSYDFDKCLGIINDIGELNEIEYSTNLKFEQPLVLVKGVQQRCRYYHNIGNFNVSNNATISTTRALQTKVCIF